MRNTSKVETLIETCRSEGKWQKVIDLTDELKTGSPNNGKFHIKATHRNYDMYWFIYFAECLAHFLVGEARLESYLEENPPIESNFAKAKSGLSDARRSLNLVTGENGKTAGIALDAYLLLAKLCYACGEYEKSLENFVKAELNTLAEKELTLYVLWIIRFFIF